MTVLQLCKAIAKTMDFLPDDYTTMMKTAYEMTWHVIYLAENDYAKPTEKMRTRLEVFYSLVDKERERLMLARTEEYLAKRIAEAQQAKK